MPWPCYVVERYGPMFKRDGVAVAWQDLPPGACWMDEGELFIKLPLNDEFPVDRGRIINESRAERGKSDRLPQWTWTGTLPRITVTPSVNCIGRYHGWIRDGVVTDDCEGRKFDAMGNPA